MVQLEERKFRREWMLLRGHLMIILEHWHSDDLYYYELELLLR